MPKRDENKSVLTITVGATDPQTRVNEAWWKIMS